MATIQLKHIKKRFGHVEVIHDLSLETKEGEFSFILGPSGAGKTTILSLIAGILPLTSGEIFINNKKINDLKPRERDVAVAFESYALYPNRTVFENIRFPLDAPIRKHELKENEKNDRIHQIADLLQIGELLNRFPRELSGGQRQRVALGRTLIRRPKVYLLDEPIAHLDAKLRHQMRGELKRLQQELKIPALCASPDQSEAISMADRIFVLNNGNIDQVGTPKDLYFKPGNEFVATTIGEPKMSIVPVRIKKDSNTYYIENDDIRYKVSDKFVELIEKKKIPKNIDIGFRHSDLEISFSEKADNYQKFAVDFFQVNGEKLIITVVKGKTRIVLRTNSTHNKSISIGDPVWVKWESENFYVFNQKTKKSLL